MHILQSALRICLLSSLLFGCSGGSSQVVPLVPVNGIVNLDGKPLANANVRFIPQPSPTATGKVLVEESTGVTRKDGSFTLAGIHAGAGPGAMAGEHRVVIDKMVMKADGSDAPANYDFAIMSNKIKQLLPPQYSDPNKTTLTATVPKAGGPINFDLVTKP